VALVGKENLLVRFISFFAYFSKKKELKEPPSICRSFKEILLETNWDQVKTELVNINSNAKDLTKLRAVYQNLFNLISVHEEDFYIDIERDDDNIWRAWKKEFYDPRTYYIMCFEDWRKVLSFYLKPSLLKIFTKEKVVAHTLLEITTEGYDLEDVLKSESNL
jgi:hypothetical protein